MLDILLIRHGDPDYANNTITELGHLQSAALAEVLRDKKLDALYSSPLGRAQHTAQYTADVRGESFETLSWIGELNGNYAEDLWAWVFSGVETHRNEIPLSMENWQEWMPYSTHMKPIYETLYADFDAFLATQGVTRQHQLYVVDASRQDKAIAIFCHGGVIATLLAHLCHLPLPVAYSQFAIDPSSRTHLHLEVENGLGNFRLMSLNDMSHAENLCPFGHAVRKKAD